MPTRRTLSPSRHPRITRHLSIWQSRSAYCAHPGCPRLARQLWRLTPYCQRHYDEQVHPLHVLT